MAHGTNWKVGSFGRLGVIPFPRYSGACGTDDESWDLPLAGCAVESFFVSFFRLWTSWEFGFKGDPSTVCPRGKGTPPFLGCVGTGCPTWLASCLGAPFSDLFDLLAPSTNISWRPRVHLTFPHGSTHSLQVQTSLNSGQSFIVTLGGESLSPLFIRCWLSSRDKNRLFPGGRVFLRFEPEQTTFLSIHTHSSFYSWAGLCNLRPRCTPTFSSHSVWRPPSPRCRRHTLVLLRSSSMMSTRAMELVLGCPKRAI